MTKIDSHKMQVQHNRLCYDYLIKAASPSYNDWCTTVLFYRALHMVDQYLAKYGAHPINHHDRYDYIKMYLPGVRIEYKQLYEASIKSRYGTDYLSTPDKGKTYHDRVFKDDFIPFSQKMTKVLSSVGP
jgi:hypothetical protein